MEILFSEYIFVEHLLLASYCLKSPCKCKAKTLLLFVAVSDGCTWYMVEMTFRLM